MRLVRRTLPVAGIVLAVSVAIIAACSDPGQATRPAIPTISAQTAGTVYCAEWSCSYDFCHLRPDWNGYSCCVEKTLEPGSAAPRPSCVGGGGGGGGSCGNYRLDGMGDYWSSLDDQWYCPISEACCGGGTGDATVIDGACGDAGLPSPCSNPNYPQYPPQPNYSTTNP